MCVSAGRRSSVFGSGDCGPFIFWRYEAICCRPRAVRRLSSALTIPSGHTRLLPLPASSPNKLL
ncbi:hypothetical protein E2C01_051239 [Portunus trituberculatus]|uniref:Uncharacterized protein n=1 Tax=Portunus trituberculatus TaxID=210409 RepID=A0A5B7GE74_PORTR|nr:hypothetical protein [Portunus trituberculatus]